MKIPPLLAHVAVFLGAALVAAFASASETKAVAPEEQRARELIHIVRQDCGSCHGLTLAGGLGPALTPDALADKPFEGLVATVVSGRPGTPMPPFRGIVSEPEAEWIVDQLMRGFPPDAGLPPSR
ncbi:MAG: cytochrome c55X [Thauera sp.]|nr:cytochrome c [Thauera sp.]MDI3489459.1 cytochrome c55X [Thauera sp.]